MSGQVPRRGEAGFTLVELIVVIVLIGIITVPLANVVIVYLRNSAATTARLNESRDVQLTSAYWAQDVASVGTRSTTAPYPFTQSVELGVAATGGNFPCGGGGTPDALVRLAWDEFSAPDAAATVVRVAYVLRAGGTELHRIRCQGSASVVSDVTIAHSLATAPEVTCSSTCTAAPGLPETITLGLTIKDPDSNGSAYTLSLAGQRRQS